MVTYIIQDNILMRDVINARTVKTTIVQFVLNCLPENFRKLPYNGTAD